MVFPKPDVFISEHDWQRLQRLVAHYPDHEAIDWLESELDRATVCLPNELPADAVQLGSVVRFQLSSSGQVYLRELVLPEQRQHDEHISVLSPVGMALLGLRVGDEIAWPSSPGQSTTVRILDVKQDRELWTEPAPDVSVQTL
ncbi:nucleoside diphosphate kinase regulator [Reinekea blandensis]|uniref:Nucleoside diphosphate kinase regulator n=1 Tax=Reinekea blandensis MED297 TaxID=314283 RepID=A4BB58_9GAMM|nr:nucleoside diphosphate kinase regulator [Reinekea blandensis]EAR10671.1 nucleoside diphosphate kinase regulator [Reinekea sp. MED297] [Reinekea blandensis MED297]